VTFPELLRAVRAMLSPRQRRRYVAIQAFFLFAGASQVLGAGSVAPFVALLSKPEIMHENAYAKSLYQWAEFSSDTQAMVALAVVMIVIMAFSNVVAAVSIWLTYRFSLSLGADLQEDLLTCYFSRDYIQMARENSTELINRVANGAPRFAFNVMQPLMIIASQGMIALTIMVALGIYQPQVVLVLGALIGCSYFILYFQVRRRLQQHGKTVWQGGEKRYRLLSEGLGGLKQIRLSGTETRYRERFMQTSRQVYHSEAIIGMLADVPRFVLETITFSALLLLASIMLWRGTDPATVIATLTLYAMTGYRLLPAGQAIFKAIAQIKSSMPALTEILDDVVEGRARRATEGDRVEYDAVPSYPRDIVLDDIWFSYNAGGPDVLRGISARIPANAMTVIVGRSGSGKSTLSDVLLGLLKPDRGRVSVGGKDLSVLGRNWYRSIGYVPQSIFILDDDIETNVQFGSATPIAEAAVLRALELAKLDDLRETPHELLRYRVGEAGAKLSGGQRQRLGLARALSHDVDYLLLDEATSALDGRTEQDILRLLKELARSRTVVMIAHRVTTIRAADHIVLLDEGRIVDEGTYQSLVANSARFRELVAIGEDEDRMSSAVAGTSEPLHDVGAVT